MTEAILMLVSTHFSIVLDFLCCFITFWPKKGKNIACCADSLLNYEELKFRNCSTFGKYQTKYSACVIKIISIIKIWSETHNKLTYYWVIN